MADLGGESASMMEPFDPPAFTAGRDEDLFLPGDSLFGFSAAAGSGSNPDMGGGDASFQGSSASMLFPPAAASFQAMASLPPESDLAAVSAADVPLSCQTSSSRRDVGGDGVGKRARTEHCAGTESGANNPPAPSLKQSLAAAIVSAATRDAAVAAGGAVAGAATAAGGSSTATTKTKTAALKPKTSAKPRRRASGGRGGRKSSNEAKARGGSGIDGCSNDNDGTSATASEATPRRPTRNLRRPRQESNKRNGQATTTAEASAATASATAVSPSGDAAIGLPAGLELIPGFEDTIDSQFMTALLQKGGSDTQSGVAGSTFACAESHGLEADKGGGGGSGSEGGGISFGTGLDASLGLAGARLLGCDTQASVAASTDADAADASQRRLFERADQSVQKPVGGGASLGIDGGWLGIPRPSTAKQEAGDARPSLSAAPPATASAVASSPLPPPVVEPVEMASSMSTAAAAAASPDAAVELAAAPEPGAMNRDRRLKPLTRSATASSPKAARGQTKTSVAVAAEAAAVVARGMKDATEPTVESPGESTTAPGSAVRCIDGLNRPTRVEVEAVAVQADAAVATPVECGLAQRNTGATAKQPRRTEDTAEGVSQAPPVLPLSSSCVASPRGSLGHASAPMARVSVENGGLSLPAAPLGAAPLADVAGSPSPPPRPLPRKVSLRFAPRDTSTENKLSEHGYIPFQKLTAPLYKPLEAVFKFMVKKWSGVAHSDLNSIRIVVDVDVDEADEIGGSSNAETRPPAQRMIVWSAEHSGKPLKDLVRSLPGSVLERICHEEAFDLTYTFSTGPIGPPPSQVSLPWDMPQQRPATAAPRPTPPAKEYQPVPRLGDIYVPSLPLRSPAVVSKGQTAAGAGAGAGVVVPRTAEAGSVAMAVAQGMVPSALATPGLGSMRNGNQSAVGAAAGGGAGGWPTAWKRRAVRGGGSPADIIANTALKRHYNIVKAMFKRQGIQSPPVTHFLPGGLFARMHTAQFFGGMGAAVGAGAGMTPGLAGLPQYIPQPRIQNSHTTARTEAREQKKDAPPAAGEPLESSEGVVDVGGDDGYEEFESGATTEVREEGGGDDVGSALMGEDTCMALFSGNGVELLVDPSSAPTGAGQGKGESSMSAAPEPPGGAQAAGLDAHRPPTHRAASSPGTHGVAASSTPPPPVASGGAEANADSLLPLTHPALPPPTDTSVAVVAQSAGPPASPSQEGCALMGEETCMALFSGGGGVELLADPSLSPQSSKAAAVAVAGGGGEGGRGEENRRDAGVAERAVQPVCSLPTGGAVASASAARQCAGKEAGEGVEPMLPLTQPDEQPGSASHTGGAAVHVGSATRPAPTSTVGVGVAAVEALGAVRAEGNAEKAGLTLQPGTKAVSAMRFEGASRGNVDAERPTPPATEAATMVEGTRPPSPCSPLAEARAGAAALCAAVAPPAVERYLQTSSSAPGEPAQGKPQPQFSRPSPPVFKVGTLPSRANFDQLPSPASTAATSTPSMASSTANRRTANPSSAGPSKARTAQLPPRPPSGERQAEAPSSSNGNASLPGKASSPTGGQRQEQQQQSELEGVAAVSGVSTECCSPAGSHARDQEAKAQVILADGVSSEAAVVFKSGGSGGGGGGGGAVTLTAPQTPPSVQWAGGAAGATEGLQEDAPLSQALRSGSRKLTRSQSNGGDPASFGSSGGGRSSRPEQMCEQVCKKVRRDTARRVPGAPSEIAAPPPRAPGVAEERGAERRKCGSGTGAARKGSDGDERRVAPTIETSGGGPQQRVAAATPVSGAPAVDVPAAAAAAAADASAASAPRPFAFASAKENGGLRADGSGPPPPPLPPTTAVGQGSSVAAVPTSNTKPACLPPAKACRTEATSVLAVAAAAAAASSVDGTPVAHPPLVKARPFAFAAAVKKGERGELLRAGDSAAPVAAAAAVTATEQTVTPPYPSGLPEAPGVEHRSPHSKSPPPSTSREVAGTTTGELVSPPQQQQQPVDVRNNVSASLSLSMSPEEVQADYLEAWSSLPSCFWDESALLGGDGGGGGGGVEGERSPAGGPVTRWLTLPHVEPTLGGMAASPAATTAAAPAPVSPAATAAAATAAAPAAATLSCEKDRGDGAGDTKVEATSQGGAPPSARSSAQRDMKQSRWASFCTAFASSRGSSNATTGASGTAAPPATGPITRAPENVRSLPTLIRLGRSMTKGMAPVERDGPEEADTGKAATAAGERNTRKGLRSAGGAAEAAGATASAPARAASAVVGKPSGNSGATPLAEAGAGGRKGGDVNDKPVSTFSGGRRKREGGGGSGDGSDAGGEGAAAAETALPKKRSKKKGRISPVFVSTLPPDSFGTLATPFSSERRA
ncbi:unnamed protein product [Pylaiella littoralis]